MSHHLDDLTVNKGYTPEGAENRKDDIASHKEEYEHQLLRND